MDITTATPVAIDTRIAELHNDLGQINTMLERARNSVFNWAGRRNWVKADRWGGKGHYEITGTYEEAREIVERMWEQEQAWRAADYADDARPEHSGDYNRSLPFDGPQKTLDEVERLSAERFRKMAQIQELDAEWVRRGCWSRFFLVVSSAGHIHSSTHCQTCRVTTAYGWLPDYSGQTEAEAIQSLGRHADALCSVCFPTAPVAVKRTNVTKAQAEKLSAATYVAE